MSAGRGLQRAEPAQAQRALVFFAVKEESRFFKLPAESHVHVVITGIGRRNAERAASEALSELSPALVLTCGFAGGLNPALRVGDVVFEADGDSQMRDHLAAVGARPARFHCANRVATTAAEKSALRQSTGADAVEMESAIIRESCRARGIPGATVRVISDAADEDLPLDFNEVFTPDYRLSGFKLARALLQSPGRVADLLRFQRRIMNASRKLGDTLRRALNS